MDGKGREGTYNFFLTTTGAAGHRVQGAAAPCHPAGAAHGRIQTFWQPRRHLSQIHTTGKKRFSDKILSHWGGRPHCPLLNPPLHGYVERCVYDVKNLVSR